MELTQSLVRHLFDYDSSSGKLYWRNPRSPRCKRGQEAGWREVSGYRCVEIDNRAYKVHRLIFLYLDGEMPAAGVEVDHINGVKDDNRIANLRLCSRAENFQNTGRRSNSDSPYKGVSYIPRLRKWQASIQANKVSYYLGVFDRPEEAAHAYNCAAIQLHGEFAVLNPIGDK